jgi:hypothetical protein
MGLYNVVFGSNPMGLVLLQLLGLDRRKVGRYRDALISKGEIAVYTRNGGGNRTCISVSPEGDDLEPSGKDCGDENCYACIIQHRLPQHPLYLRDQDDDFDSTYATIYFKFPEQFAAELQQLDTGEEFKPSERWQAVIAALQEANKQK